MSPVKYMKALLGYKDVEAFWEAREEILKTRKKHILGRVLCKVIRRHYGSGIHVKRDIHRFHTPHGFYGIFISKNAKIGDGCTIFHHVTIGAECCKNAGEAPTIGRNCYIGADAKIIGNVIVGNNVRIGANAIVVNDIPDNCTVVMNKPRVIVRKNDEI